MKLTKQYLRKLINEEYSEQKLENALYDLIQGNIYLRDVPYSMEEGAQ